MFAFDILCLDLLYDHQMSVQNLIEIIRSGKLNRDEE